MKKLKKNCRWAAFLLLMSLFFSGCGDRTEELVLISESVTDTGAEMSREASSPAPLLVHVCGAVRCPGVYELAPGDRIFDAVEAAGGFSEEAAGHALNLAQPVEDGVQIRVPTQSEAAELLQAVSVSSDPGKININTAGEEELTSLNGIGESRARDILTYRKEYGPFRSIEDIKQVPGIKNAVFEKIKDDITV